MLIGLILLLIGLFIRYLSFKELNNKNFWKIYKTEKLITTGLYKYIRHPMYLGSLFSCFGLFYLLTQSIGTTICLLYISLNFLFQRIDFEEKLLKEQFGLKYVLYEKKTKRLIPFIF